MESDISKAAAMTHAYRSTGGFLAAVMMLVGSTLAPGCAQGIEPPDPTVLKEIKGGLFLLGSTRLSCTGKTALETCDASSLPGQLTWAPGAWVSLNNFQIEAQEVSNQQYRWCVDADACSPPANPRSWRRYDEAAYDHHPVVYVSRDQASDYCRFIQRRLPTEAEWEAAARANHDAIYSMRTFPHKDSSIPGCKKTTKPYLAYRTTSCTAYDGPLKPDYSPDDRTPEGVRNMASNVAEWVKDDWRVFGACGGADSSDYCVYEKDPPSSKGCVQACDGRGAVCRPATYSKPLSGTNPTDGVVRGGSYNDGLCHMRLFIRRVANFSLQQPWLGFRCAVGQPERPLDSGPELSVDSSMEGGMDSSVEGGVDSGMEGGMDSSVEGGMDSSVEGGMDSGR